MKLTVVDLPYLLPCSLMLIVDLGHSLKSLKNPFNFIFFAELMPFIGWPRLKRYNLNLNSSYMIKKAKSFWATWKKNYSLVTCNVNQCCQTKMSRQSRDYAVKTTILLRNKLWKIYKNDNSATKPNFSSSHLNGQSSPAANGDRVSTFFELLFCTKVK